MIFTVVFTIEMIIKLLALRAHVSFFYSFSSCCHVHVALILTLHHPPRLPTPFLLAQHYFIDPWNSFDALIVVGSVLDIAVSEFSVSSIQLN